MPRLRILSIVPVALEGIKSELGVSQWQDCIPALVEACPLLLHLNDLYAEGGEKQWDVSYARDGKISVIQAV